MGDLHLDRLEALGDVTLGFLDHAVAAAAAPTAAAVGRDLGAVMTPEPMQRERGPLAERVPERDVEGRDRHHGNALAACGVGGAPEIAPNGLDRRGVAAEHARHDRLLEAHGDRAQDRRQGVEVPHADDAVLGLDLEHQKIAGLAERVSAHPRVVGPGHAQERRAHLADRHVGHGLSRVPLGS